MPPFRIPFTSRRGPVVNGTEANDENARPASHNANNKNSPYSSKPSLALGVKEKKIEPNEFKLSSVDSEGQYLPPSPTEKQTFWSKTKSPSTTSNHRNLITENEPFSISRESFDSYRRSFDVSGRSPITHADSYNSRSSLDSRTFQLSRPAVNGNTFDRPEPIEDDNFDDVKLNDESNRTTQPKKKSFLSRFSESNNDAASDSKDGKDGKHHFHFPGRKRGQSGSGSELGEVKRPDSRGQTKPEVTVS